MIKEELFISRHKGLITILVSVLCTINLLGCQNGTPIINQEESKETENIQNNTYSFSNVLGIENASVSPYNTLVDFEEIDKILEETFKDKNIVNPEEIQYGGTVYVDDNYSTNDTYTYETESNITETSEIIIEPNQNMEYIDTSPSQTFVGTYDITAYTWTGNPMANGEYPYEGCVASCDFAIGTILYIEGIGTYVVKDVCPTSGVIDIYMSSYDACIQFGRQYRNIYVVN